MTRRRLPAPTVETLETRAVPAIFSWTPRLQLRPFFGSVSVSGTNNADRITINDVAGVPGSIRITVRDESGMNILSSQTYSTTVQVPVSLFGPVRFQTMSRSITVNGLGGNDRITNLSTFGLTMDGGVGNDTVRSGTAADWMYGGEDADLMYGGGGGDVMYGGGGADEMYGHLTLSAADLAADDGGADFMDGGAGGDRIWGGRGNDVLRGGTEDDRLWGADGHDGLDGGSGKDTAEGGLGDDVLFGGLDGQNDDLWGGTDGDTFQTANGRDTFYYEYVTQFQSDNLKDWNPSATATAPDMDTAFQNQRPPGL
jgi:Ca2+-binding RTX toxin-like protein